VTARDRTVLTVLAFVGVLAAFWFLAMSPKRKDAKDIDAQVTTAQQRLETAQASAATAESARKRYDDDYATVARLGKAVPVDDDVPSLVYQLEATARSEKIDFRSIRVNSSAAAATPAAAKTATGSSSAALAALPPGATVGTAGFPVMPFSMDFDGSFFGLQRLLGAMNDLTKVKGDAISVSGRLLTVDGFQLKASPEGFPKIDATVSVSSYLVPADEGATGGATVSGPAATTTTTTTTTNGATASMIGGN
jgi:hypothetical protein